MGDMLRRAYGDEYPNYYINPSDYYIDPFGKRQIREGAIIQYERDFPTAMEMRKRGNSLTDADNLVLDEITRLLNEAHDCTSVTYEGCLSSAVKKFLCEKGYKISAVRKYNADYTTISWRE